MKRRYLILVAAMVAVAGVISGLTWTGGLSFKMRDGSSLNMLNDEIDSITVNDAGDAFLVYRPNRLTAIGFEAIDSVAMDEEFMHITDTIIFSSEQMTHPNCPAIYPERAWKYEIEYKDQSDWLLLGRSIDSQGKETGFSMTTLENDMRESRKAVVRFMAEGDTLSTVVIQRGLDFSEHGRLVSRDTIASYVSPKPENYGLGEWFFFPKVTYVDTYEDGYEYKEEASFFRPGMLLPVDWMHSNPTLTPYSKMVESRVEQDFLTYRNLYHEYLPHYADYGNPEYYTDVELVDEEDTGKEAAVNGMYICALFNENDENVKNRVYELNEEYGGGAPVSRLLEEFAPGLSGDEALKQLPMGWYCNSRWYNKMIKARTDGRMIAYYVVKDKCWMFVGHNGHVEIFEPPTADYKFDVDVVDETADYVMMRRKSTCTQHHDNQLPEGVDFSTVTVDSLYYPKNYVNEIGGRAHRSVFHLQYSYDEYNPSPRYDNAFNSVFGGIETVIPEQPWLHVEKGDKSDEVWVSVSLYADPWEKPEYEYKSENGWRKYFRSSKVEIEWDGKRVPLLVYQTGFNSAKLDKTEFHFGPDGGTFQVTGTTNNKYDYYTGCSHYKLWEAGCEDWIVAVNPEEANTQSYYPVDGVFKLQELRVLPNETGQPRTAKIIIYESNSSMGTVTVTQAAGAKNAKAKVKPLREMQMKTRVKNVE